MQLEFYCFVTIDRVLRLKVTFFLYLLLKLLPYKLELHLSEKYFSFYCFAVSFLRQCFVGGFLPHSIYKLFWSCMSKRLVWFSLFHELSLIEHLLFRFFDSCVLVSLKKLYFDNFEFYFVQYLIIFLFRNFFIVNTFSVNRLDVFLLII